MFYDFTDVYHVNVNNALELANQSVHYIGFKYDNNNNILVFPYKWCYLNTESLNKNSKTKQITTATRKKNKHS